MRHKEFIRNLAKDLQLPTEETEVRYAAFLEVVKSALERGDKVNLQGFGSFEVRKKEERVFVNPATAQKTLIPPRLSLAFKPSALWKEKLNNTDVQS